MVGAGGFEPPHGGIKIRCLTAWRRPSARASAHSVVGLRRRRVKPALSAPLPAPPQRPPARRPPLHRSRRRRCLRRGREQAEAGRPRAAHPRQQAARLRPQRRQRRATAGQSAVAAASRSFSSAAQRRRHSRRVIPARRQVGRHRRTRRRGRETPPRCASGTPGLTSTIPNRGKRGAGASTSPTPSIRAGRPARHTGTSAPSVGRNRRQIDAPHLPLARKQPQRRRRVGRAAANSGRHRQIASPASAAPLPRRPPPPPAPGPRAAPDCRPPPAPAANRPVTASDSAAAGVRRQPVADAGEHRQAVEPVIPVRPPAEDVQIEVDLGRRDLRAVRHRAQRTGTGAARGAAAAPCRDATVGAGGAGFCRSLAFRLGRIVAARG